MISIGLNEYNKYIDREYIYTNGINFYNEMCDAFGEENILLFDTQSVGAISDVNEQITIIVFGQDIDIYNENMTPNTNINVPSIYVSDYLGYLIGYEDGVNEDFLLNESTHVNIMGTFETNYLENSVLTMRYYEEHKSKFLDEYMYEYNVIFMSEQDYLNIFVSDSISAVGLELKQYKPSMYYFNNKLQYNVKTDGDVILGREIQLDNEILVSFGYYEKLLESYSVTNLEGLSQIELNPYDFEDIVNSISYYSEVNMKRIFSKELFVVGVVDEHQDIIYVSNEKLEEIKSLYLYSYVTGFTTRLDDNDVMILPFLSDGRMFVNNMNGKIIEELATVLYKSFSGIFKVVSLVFTLLSMLIIYANISRLLEDRLKEIGILKSMNVKSRSIMGIFIFYSTIILVISSTFAVALSIMGTYYLNNELILNGTLGMSYDILTIDYFSIGFSLIVSIIVMILAVIIPMVRLHKYSPAQILRIRD